MNEHHKIRFEVMLFLFFLHIFLFKIIYEWNGWVCWIIIRYKIDSTNNSNSNSNMHSLDHITERFIIESLLLYSFRAVHEC